MSKMEKLGALWLKESKGGMKFMSGKIGDQQIVVFKNRNKRSDRHPDYEIFKSEPRPRQQEQESSNEEYPF